MHWSRIEDVLKQAGDLSGKVILTCSLPMDPGNTKLINGATNLLDIIDYDMIASTSHQPWPFYFPSINSWTIPH